MHLKQRMLVLTIAVNACKSCRLLRAFLKRLAKDNIVGCINDLDSLVAQSIRSDDHFEKAWNT